MTHKLNPRDKVISNTIRYTLVAAILIAWNMDNALGSYNNVLP